MEPKYCGIKGKYFAHIKNKTLNHKILYSLRILLILKTEWCENVPEMYIYDINQK